MAAFRACHSQSDSLASAHMSDQKSSVDWERLEAKPEFRALIRKKARFIIGATIFFMAYYLALPILVGYFPDLMKQKVWGEVNIAYAFALSQFFMAFGFQIVHYSAFTKSFLYNSSIINNNHI
jgi:uncharacterized membrane protein (DUF485 family)